MIKLFRKLNSIPFSKRILIYVIVPALSIAIFVKFFYLPSKAEINQLKKQLLDAQGKIEKLKQAEKRLHKLNLELQDINRKFLELTQLLPDKKEIPDLLSDVSALGNKCHLEFLLFQPEKENPKDFYAEVPITLVIQGRYVDAEDFLSKISELPRIINIPGLKFGSPKMKEDTVILKADVQMVIYRFIPKKAGLHEGKKDRK